MYRYLLPKSSIGSSLSGISRIPEDNGVCGGETDSASSMTKCSAEIIYILLELCNIRVFSHSRRQ